MQSRILSHQRSRKIKSLVRDYLPPVVYRFLTKFLGGRSNRISFEGEFNTWQEAAAKSTGYNAEHILDKVLEASLKVKDGKAAFSRDSVLFEDPEYVWPVLAGSLLAATHCKGTLNVLDFGGALGSSYFQNRNFLHTLHQVQWNIVEQPHYVKAGREHIQSEELRFYETVEACLNENRPNVVLLSNVLQYVPEPDKIVKDLVSAESFCIILDRTMVNLTNKHQFYVQRVPPAIYSASYPCCSLSENWIFESLSNSYELEASFSSFPLPVLATIGAEFKGYIFRKRD